MNSDEKILIVDDDRIFLTYIKAKLSDKFNIITAVSGMQGLELFGNSGPFALVAVDYLMSEMNGVEFLEKVCNKYPETVRMMITGITDSQSLLDIINNVNIYRIINKPCSAAVLNEILEKGIGQYRLVQSEKIKKEEADAANKQLINYATALNETVTSLKKKNKELNDAYIDTIHRLVIASEYKDEDTHDHIIRMSRYSALLAKKLGFTTEDVNKMLFASPMHDIGKIGIPDSIMMNTGKLTDNEFNEIKKHTVIGSRILEGSKAGILNLAGSIALSHHERWDGRGYPFGLKCEDIPVHGRIAALADTFDALTSKRPYKDAYPVEVAYDIIKKEKEKQFEPDIVDIFIDYIDEFVRIKEEITPADKTDNGVFILSERDSS